MQTQGSRFMSGTFLKKIMLKDIWYTLVKNMAIAVVNEEEIEFVVCGCFNMTVDLSDQS